MYSIENANINMILIILKNTTISEYSKVLEKS